LLALTTGGGGKGEGVGAATAVTDADGSGTTFKAAPGSVGEVTAAAANAAPNATSSTSGVTKLHSGTSPPAKRTRCASAPANEGNACGLSDGRGRTNVAALRALATLMASVGAGAGAAGAGAGAA